MSMGTVYRNMNVLMEQGLIKKIEFGSTYDRFDANIGPHYHFICERCGAIVDLEVPVDRRIEERVEESTPYTVTRHRIEFYGICDQCRKRGGGEEE